MVLPVPVQKTALKLQKQHGWMRNFSVLVRFSESEL